MPMLAVGMLRPLAFPTCPRQAWAWHWGRSERLTIRAHCDINHGRGRYDVCENGNSSWTMKPKKPTKPYWQMTAKELAKATAQFDKEFVIDRSVELNAAEKAQWLRAKRQRKESR